MITDLNIQHELLKTALDATDGYLGVEKHAKDQGYATDTMLHDFSYHMARAHDALQSLGVLNKHQDYMGSHVDEMAKLHGNRDSSIADLPYTHVPKADFGDVEESVSPRLISFKSFMVEANETSDEITDKEIDKMVDDLDWNDIEDLYSHDEFEEEDEDREDDEDKDDKEMKEETLSERISAQARLKKRQAFSRSKGRRNVSRSMKLKRASTTEQLEKRAVMAARRALYQKYLKGRNKSTLSATEKDRIEQQVKKMKSVQSALASKMMSKIRSLEQKRLANYRSTKK